VVVFAALKVGGTASLVVLLRRFFPPSFFLPMFYGFYPPLRSTVLHHSSTDFTLSFPSTAYLGSLVFLNPSANLRQPSPPLTPFFTPAKKTSPYDEGEQAIALKYQGLQAVNPPPFREALLGAPVFPRLN